MEPGVVSTIDASPHFDRDILHQLSHAHEGIVRTIYQRLNPADIEFPRFVTVGKRGSGKSSLLEGITRLQFPTAATRFATTVAFRPFCQDGLQITIRNSTDHRIVPPDNIDGKLSTIVDDVTRILQGETPQQNCQDQCWNETLRIQISSQNYVPHLTFVDLPGLKPGSQEQDAAVPRLYRKFLKHPGSIILAVISADDLNGSREVFDEVKRYDANLERTICIITKPDTMHNADLESQQLCLTLLKNGIPSYKPALGCHVVRNRSRTGNQHFLADDVLHEREVTFFQASVWSTVDSRDRDVKALRDKLGRVFASRIRWKNPAIQAKIQGQIEHEKTSLSQQQGVLKSQVRAYLSKLSSDFRNLVTTALRGDHSDALYTSRPNPRLRSNLGKLNYAFCSTMLSKGHSLNIHWGGELGASLGKHRQRLHPCYEFTDPITISIEDLYCMKEAFATRNPSTDQTAPQVEKLSIPLFRHQSLPWEQIATTHLCNVLQLVETFVRELIAVVAGDSSSATEAIVQQFLLPFLVYTSNTVRDKVQELLHHYRTAHDPLCEDLWGVAGGQKCNQRRLQRNVSTDDAGFQFEQAVENMEVHYERVVRVFTENINTLAVETCLLRELPNILSPDKINSLGNEDIIRFAQVLNPTVAESIQKAEKDIQGLEETWEICREYFERVRRKECASLLAPEDRKTARPPVPRIRLTPPTYTSTSTTDVTASQMRQDGNSNLSSPVSACTGPGSGFPDTAYLSVAYRPSSRAAQSWVSWQRGDQDMPFMEEGAHDLSNGYIHDNGSACSNEYDNQIVSPDFAFTKYELLTDVSEQSFQISGGTMDQMAQYMAVQPMTAPNKRPRESEDDEQRYAYMIRNNEWTRVECPGYGDGNTWTDRSGVLHFARLG
ncbi:P-loop containing nucleoside triphosphate hydrolase protein [Podospora australis]|uniref:P-loop containing nucleoside triphosphate hydrolase protein n=1 Tax=Podospora australis TaxID=1536484 RepID=A0AAN6WHV0_9PEZI|nr:P-loop containing nucleoside triphosphate hydrolase protein [Podospora australis]